MPTEQGDGDTQVTTGPCGRLDGVMALRTVATI